MKIFLIFNVFQPLICNVTQSDSPDVGGAMMRVGAESTRLLGLHSMHPTDLHLRSRQVI